MAPVSSPSSRLIAPAVRRSRRGPLVSLRCEVLEDRVNPADLFTVQNPITNLGLNNNGFILTDDFNKDGFADAVLVNSGGSTATVLYGTAAGGFAKVTLGTGGTAPFFAAAGDVNGDGWDDLLVLNNNSDNPGTVQVFLNDKSGNLVASGSPFSTNGQGSVWVGLGDFTGDGKLDAAVCSFGKGDQGAGTITGNNLTVFQGNGDGTFTQARVLAPNVAFIPTAASIGDFNNDGKLDIVAVVPGVPSDFGQPDVDGSVWVFTGTGAGDFNQPVTYDSMGIFPIAITAADLNGDNKLDLVVANAGNAQGTPEFSGNSVGVLINGGGANFLNGNALSGGTLTHGVFATVAADFNMDGKMDIAAVNYGGQLGSPNAFVTVWIGNGSGSFLPATPTATYDTKTGSGGGQYLAVADVDHNGTPDLLVAHATNNLGILLNNTTPSTPTTTALTATPAGPTAYGTSVTLDATVTATSGTPNAGQVTFFDGGNTLGTATVDANGKAELVLPATALGVGAHSLTAQYGGTNGFAQSAKSSPAVSFTVNKAGTTTALVADKTTVTLGDPVNLTATVTVNAPSTAAPVGTVTFLDNGNPLGPAVPVQPDGTAKLTVLTLGVGSHNVTAQFSGGVNFVGSTSSPPVVVTVNSIATSTQTVVTAVPNPGTVGQAVTLGATVTVTSGTGTPTGSVIFFDGTTAISGPLPLDAQGQASFPTAALGIGAHSITAQYSPGIGFNGSTSPAVTVTMNATTQTVLLVTPTVFFGQQATVTATVTSVGGIPIGTVQFFDNGAAIGTPVAVNAQGQATFQTSALAVGGHPITAQFTPAVGSNFLGSSTAGSSTVTVNAASTSVNLVGPAGGVTSFGQNAVFTATVSSPTAGPVTGSVQFKNGATVLATIPLTNNGGQMQAVLTRNDLDAGTYSIIAVYAPDTNNFAASQGGPSTLTVNKAATTTALTVPAAPTTFGQPVALTASVTAPGTGKTPVGTVTFFDGATQIGGPVALDSNGQAVFTTPANAPLAAGGHQLSAHFVGSTNFAAGDSPQSAFTVNKAGTTTVVSATNPALFGQQVSITATVSAGFGTPAGQVQFTENGTVLGTVALVASGGQQVATLTTSSLGAGTHPITATYLGSTNYAGSASAAVGQVVNPMPTSTDLTVSATSAAPGQAVTLTAGVDTARASAVGPTGTVTFLVNGQTIGTAPLVNRAATLTTTSLPTGNDIITAAFAGDQNFVGSTSSGVNVVVTAPTVPPPPVTETPTPVLIGFKEFGVGIGAGASGTARFFNPDGSERFTADIFPGFTGGVRVTSADFNGDGVADIVAGTGPGGPSHVIILDGKTRDVLFSIDPFESSFTGGVYVATGDVTGDGVPDLVISPDEGGGPRVRVFNGKGFGQVADFLGIDDPNFRGGARAGIGDINGDGVGDLVVSAGFGGGPRVSAYDGTTLGGGRRQLFPDFFLFEDSLRNGVFIAVGDLDGDGRADLIGGGGPGGGPRVLALSGKDKMAGVTTVLANFFGGDQANRGGIRVAARNLDGDNQADIVVGAGEAAGSRVTGYLGKNIKANGTPPQDFAFEAFPGFTGGVYVG